MTDQRGRVKKERVKIIADMKSRESFYCSPEEVCNLALDLLDALGKDDAASVSDDMRLSVLTPRERAELRVGRAVIAEIAAWKAWDKKAGDLAIAKCHAAEREREAAIAEFKVLTLEVTNG